MTGAGRKARPCSVFIMSAFSGFHEYFRLLLGDHDPDIRLYDTDQFDAAMRMVLNFGEMQGFDANTYVVGGDSVSVTPDISGKALSVLIYKSVIKFTPHLTVDRRLITRAVSESVGGNKEIHMAMLQMIYDLDQVQVG